MHSLGAIVDECFVPNIFLITFSDIKRNALRKHRMYVKISESLCLPF